jgi:hypothetical protein
MNAILNMPYLRDTCPGGQGPQPCQRRQPKKGVLFLDLWEW